MVNDFCVVVPMANESATFLQFTQKLASVLDKLGKGKVYLVTDHASVDGTRELCDRLSAADNRFAHIFEPGNRHVVDAYRRGLCIAATNGHEIIIEMDAGLSHDPAQLPDFIAPFGDGYECVFGSRTLQGAIFRSPVWRKSLSRSGTWFSNVLLGTKGTDMTSGYHAYSGSVAQRLCALKLFSTGHFYQTEVRYLLRNTKWKEVAIRYTSPSPRVSRRSIMNAAQTLLKYTLLRITGKPVNAI